MPLLKLPNGRWRVQIRRKGLPSFDRVFATEPEARLEETRQLALPAEGFVPLELTLAELWARYAASIEFRHKTVNTQRTEMTRIKPVLVVLGAYAIKHLEAAPILVYDFVDKRSATVSPRTKRVMSPTSVRLEIAALSAVFIWAKKRRLIRENFVRLITRPVQLPRKRRMAVVELSALKESTDDCQPRVAEAARFIRLLRLLGCRPGELAGLECQDVSLATSNVTFRRTKHEREDRTVHVSEAAASTIAGQINYINDTVPGAPFLFPTAKRLPQSDRSEDRYAVYNYAWAVKLLRKRGIVGTDFHAHAARREFVSRAIEDGLPYATIRKQTGHHSTAAIEMYDRGLATAPEIRDALNRHAQTVSDDELVGLLARFDISDKDATRIMQRVKGGKKNGIHVEYPVPLIVSDLKKADFEG